MAEAKKRMKDALRFENVEDEFMNMSASKKRKRTKKKAKPDTSHEPESAAVEEETLLKACASTSDTQGLALPGDASAIADPNSLTDFLNSLSLKADEERMRSWNSEELMDFGSTRIFQVLLAHIHAAHRMKDMKSDAAKHKNENTKLTIANCELKNRTEKALADQRVLRAKLETVEKEKDELLADKAALERKIEEMDDSMKFVASRSHLKTKYDLYKQWEEHGGKEWDREKTYVAWERFAKSLEEGSGEEDASEDDGEEEAEETEEQPEGASADNPEKENASLREKEEVIEDLHF